MNYQEKIKETTEKYTQDLEQDKNKYELLREEKNDMEMEYEEKIKQMEEKLNQAQERIKKITEEIMEQALAQAREARLHILGEMNKVISEARPTVSETAAAMATIAKSVGHSPERPF